MLRKKMCLATYLAVGSVEIHYKAPKLGEVGGKKLLKEAKQILHFMRNEKICCANKI